MFTVGQQAADELADLLEKARLVSRTLYAESEHLVAVNPKSQKVVDADLKRAKEALEPNSAATASNCSPMVPPIKDVEETP